MFALFCAKKKLENVGRPRTPENRYECLSASCHCGGDIVALQGAGVAGGNGW